MTAIQHEQARNPWRSTWDVLLALEAAERIAAGEFDETVTTLPLRKEKPAFVPTEPDDDLPMVAAAG